MKKVFFHRETNNVYILDIVESTGKVVDEFWEKTDKGPLFKGNLYHIDEVEKLKDIAARATAKRKELEDIEAELYRVKR